ncbi:MAG: hypothetical protein ORN54_01645, partial [Cyclobacteriaceae bacterium]|nr:hypothetical protein [Cyclobacteriaceae bacterium]
MKNKQKLLLLVPALWASSVDILLTIICQPKEYWQGNLQSRNEANPIGAFLMEKHISGLFIVSGIWLVIIALLGYYLPRRLS